MSQGSRLTKAHWIVAAILFLVLIVLPASGFGLFLWCSNIIVGDEVAIGAKVYLNGWYVGRMGADYSKVIESRTSGKCLPIAFFGYDAEVKVTKEGYHPVTEHVIMKDTSGGVRVYLSPLSLDKPSKIR